MDDLAQWLGEQLDEDERIARAATPGPWHVRDDGVVGDDGDHWPVAYTDSHRAGEDCLYIAEHDPVRALREVDAKRRILAPCVAALEERPAIRARMRELIYKEPDEFARLHREENRLIEVAESLAPVVALLALPYADRPGYREEWALPG
ncbi:DUF6221 family protein [Streptomyces sp. NPDC059753]|uniref:DUF6221 family protein n=1 Tax=Streptomyces sp. NPDC059753 TaxID=3346933 RepID=UPI00365CEBBF